MTNLRVLNTFIYPHDAHMAKNYLESQGIEVLLKDELSAQVNNFYSNAIGGVKIMVREEDLNRGLDILKQGGYVIPEDELKRTTIEPILLSRDTDKSTCPYCKSQNIGRKKEPNILVLVVYFLMGAFFPIFRRSCICFDCAKEWKFTKKI